MAQYWYRVHHMDRWAVCVADKHYSRQNPGSREFTRPGNKVVLLHFDSAGEPSALWASHRPDPASGVKRADGRDCWDCSMFRVERRTVQASVLIREAVAVTKSVWGEPLPADGFITTVDPRHVAPIRRRGELVWGYCYLKAGWQLMPERTKARSLIIWQLPLAELESIQPVQAMSEQASFL